MTVDQPISKRAVLEELLERGMVLIALDARKGGVDVPPRLAGDLQLRLNLSYRFGLPMTLSDWGVHATLTFNGISYACKLPWSSIFLMVSHVGGEPRLFSDDVPPELVDNQQAHPRSDSGAVSGTSRLKLVTEASDAAQDTQKEEMPSEMPPVEEAPKDEPPTPPTKTRGHLRLVK
jgi:stringent starvation protein B